MQSDNTEHTTNKHNSRLFSILNQPVTIWFLSSIVLSGATYLYTQYTNYQKQFTTKQNRIIELDLEFANRILLLHQMSEIVTENYRDDPLNSGASAEFVFIALASDIGIIQQQSQTDNKQTAQKRKLMSIL